MIFIILFALQRQALRACRKAVNLTNPLLQPARQHKRAYREKMSPLASSLTSCCLPPSPSQWPVSASMRGIRQRSSVVAALSSCNTTDDLLRAHLWTSKLLVRKNPPHAAILRVVLCLPADTSASDKEESGRLGWAATQKMGRLRRERWRERWQSGLIPEEIVC